MQINDKILTPNTYIRLSTISTYVAGFFNTGIRVSKKVEGGSGFFKKTENLPHAIEPPNNTIFPIKN
jgi:hypothetical protein